LALVQISFTLLAGPLRRPALIARHCQSVPAEGGIAASFSVAVTAIATAFVADVRAHAAKLAPANGGGAILIGQQLSPTSAKRIGCNA
jgi:hypothetical protein